MKDFQKKSEYQSPEARYDSLWPENILCLSKAFGTSVEGFVYDPEEDDYEWEI